MIILQHNVLYRMFHQFQQYEHDQFFHLLGIDTWGKGVVAEVHLWWVFFHSNRFQCFVYKLIQRIVWWTNYANEFIHNKGLIGNSLVKCNEISPLQIFILKPSGDMWLYAYKKNFLQFFSLFPFFLLFQCIYVIFWHRYELDTRENFCVNVFAFRNFVWTTFWIWKFSDCKSGATSIIVKIV